MLNSGWNVNSKSEDTSFIRRLSLWDQTLWGLFSETLPVLSAVWINFSVRVYRRRQNKSKNHRQNPFFFHPWSVEITVFCTKPSSLWELKSTVNVNKEWRARIEWVLGSGRAGTCMFFGFHDIFALGSEANEVYISSLNAPQSRAPLLFHHLFHSVYVFKTSSFTKNAF